jgi:Arc/MetJ family transcription regulator
MPTTLALDDRLLEEALRLGGHPSKKATVDEALREYVQRRKRLRLLDEFGKVEVAPRLAHKRARRRG